MNGIPLLHRKVKFRRDLREWLLLAPSGKLLTLNDIGKLVLDLCDGSRTVTDIVERVTHAYQLEDAGRVREDIEQFLRTVARAQCITIVALEYVQPKIELRTADGTRSIEDIDEAVFFSDASTDPPCQ